MELIPFAGTRGRDLPIVLPAGQLQPLGAGEFEGVHISIESAALEMFIATLEQWFEEREEVIFVNSGVSSKLETGFIVLEWEECRIDHLFLRILDTTEFIVDYSVYVRSIEEV